MGTQNNLFPCDCCGRNFAKDVLERHEVICFKSSQKKRKVFDSRKQRLQGSGAIVSGTFKKQEPPSSKLPTRPKPDWRARHLELVNSIRAAREVTIAMKTGAPLPPPPPPTVNPDYVQCPHCLRSFNQHAAERHMPFCKDQKSRLGPASNVKDSPSKKPQYRPPLPSKKTMAADPPKNLVTPARVNPTQRGGRDSKDSGSSQDLLYRPDYSDGSSSESSRSSTRVRSPSPARYTQPSRLPQKSQVDVADFRSKTTTKLQGNYRTSEKVRATEPWSQPDTSMTQKPTLSSWDKIASSNLSKTVPAPERRQEPVADTRPTNARTMTNRPNIVGLNSRQDISHHNDYAEDGYRPLQTVSSPSIHTNVVGGREELMMNAGKSTGAAAAFVSTRPPEPKQANFCYECGSKFPTQTARFCSECGVRRALAS